MLSLSAGVPYEIARIMCNMSGAFLLTHMDYLWAVINHEEKQGKTERQQWERLGRAFGKCELRWLERASLDKSLLLRREGLLVEMRSFMRRIWTRARSDEEHGEQEAIRVGEELEEEVAKADDEWRRAGRTLAPTMGLEAAGLFGALETGNPLWLAGGLVAKGIASWASTRWQHYYAMRSPAGFFLRMKRESERGGSLHNRKR